MYFTLTPIIAQRFYRVNIKYIFYTKLKHFYPKTHDLFIFALCLYSEYNKKLAKLIIIRYNNIDYFIL